MSSAQNLWPPWNNAPITLFHGTTLGSATDIVNRRVDLLKCLENSDFGIGFYTTTHREQATIFSKKTALKSGGPPSVIRISLDRKRLGELRTVAFVRGKIDATDFWSFIAHCRAGLPHIPQSAIVQYYDVAYGPVASKWQGPQNSMLWEGYDQISFHTETAVAALNDKSICTMEIL